MCELLTLSSHLPATINLSLDEFARHGGSTAPNRDGWGIAYDMDGDVRLLKEARPASSSDLVRFIEAHDLRGRIILSHIRRATQGAPALRNTQPFSRELGGRMHLFIHNGDLGDLASHRDLRPGRHRPVGETDSEYAFCVLLGWLEDLWLADTASPPLARRLAVFSRFVETVRELGPANIIYTDGDATFLHSHVRHDSVTGTVGPPGLHLLERTCREAPEVMPRTGFRVTPDRAEQRLVLAASVPLTAEAWTPMDAGQVVALVDGRVIASG
ncbi:MAG: class II glutamine amidotransferase [Acidobacteriota bacterium]